MSKRFVDTGKYRQAWRKLDPKLRAAFYWLTENSDAAGYWTIDLDHFKFECGYALDIERLIRETGAVEKHGAKVLRLVDFIETNYGALKEGYNPHKPALRALAHHQLSSLNQASLKLEDEEEDEEEDTKEKERASVDEPATPFETWWALYGKGSKKLSSELWARMPEVDRIACIAATPAYIRSKPEVKFRKDGERFLRHRTWEDEIVGPSPVLNINGGMTKEQADEEMRQIRIKHGRDPLWGWVGDEECSRELLIYRGVIKERKAS